MGGDWVLIDAVVDTRNLIVCTFVCFSSALDDCPLAYPRVDAGQLLFPDLPCESRSALSRTDERLTEAVLDALSSVSTDYMCVTVSWSKVLVEIARN